MRARPFIKLEQGAIVSVVLLPHGANHPGADPSATTIVPVVVDLLAPRSVVDVGCGTAAWAAAFVRCGVPDVVGVDAAYVRPSLMIPPEQFIEAELAEPLCLGRKFDLAVSLEVAEHLPYAVGGTFVASLCEHADLVLFSAAPPGQGGIGHINMEWPSYWAGLFGQHGFRGADLFRARFWNDEAIMWWYRQNLLLFGTEQRLAECCISPTTVLDLAHPALIAHLLDRFAHEGD
ncbi:MAG: methyltransferase domain-containing protein [Actinomycetota bacterium]|nr:methyltransferase domain-containing protein [Actinomycetota bacterium]